MNSVSENLQIVHDKIARVACDYGRNPATVQLIAVSKQQPADKIMAALAAGQRVFGENRVQEAQQHWRDLKTTYPDLVLHLIGPLQTNKVREAVRLFDVIETVDRADLVRALAQEMKKQGRTIPCFVQVNTGAEEQKAGILPEDLSALLSLCRDEGLEISGLMCIPPVTEPPSLHFAFLRQLANAHHLANLSMGMTADFEKAVALGATYVRVGTALFGER